jgi:hypothetical protein
MSLEYLLEKNLLKNKFNENVSIKMTNAKHVLSWYGKLYPPVQLKEPLSPLCGYF